MKSKFVLRMLFCATVAVACASLAHAQHTPVITCPSGGIGANASDRKLPYVSFLDGDTGVPIEQGLDPMEDISTADKETLQPNLGSIDFCGALDTCYCSAYALAGLAPEVANFANLVACFQADINGPVNPNAELPVAGNGMVDGQFELGVLAAVLNDPTFNVNGVTYDDVVADFSANYAFLNNLIWEALRNASFKGEDKGIDGMIKLLTPYLPCGLAYVLAGYVTLGDRESIEAISILLNLLEDIGMEPPSPENLKYTPGIFGPTDDLDGDGYCNRLEYDTYFDSGNPAAYVNAAIDPETHPSGTTECPGIAFNFSDAYKFNPATGHVYRITAGIGSFETLQAYAEGHTIGEAALPGYLMTINDAAENQWLLDQSMLYDDRLIGLNDLATAGTYVWASGDAVSYTNWRDGEPNGAEDHYVEVRGAEEDNAGAWEDTDSTSRFGIIEITNPCAEDGLFVDADSDGVPEFFLDENRDGTPDGNGCGVVKHSADQDDDHQISVSELLRVIQFFNSTGYQCSDAGEDGYAPGKAAADSKLCGPHSSDYNPQNWEINLSELLRLIQFFNSGGFTTAADTEDGFTVQPVD